MKPMFNLLVFFLFFLFSTSVSASSRGMNFDGVNDHYKVDLGSDWSSPTWTVESTFTLRSWNTKQFDHLFSLGGNHLLTMYVNSIDKRIVFKGLFNGEKKEFFISNLSLNYEYHIAAVFNGSTLVIYLNNKQVQSISVNNSVDQLNSILLVGADGYNTNFFKGEISEFALWNKALTQSEIFDVSKTGNESNLIAWYQFNPLSTGKAYDLSHHNHDVTGMNFNPITWQLRSTTIQPNAISWTWNKNPYASSYRLKRDGSTVYDGSSSSASDTSVSPGVTYAYSLQSFSNVGESSPVNQIQHSGPKSFLSFNGTNRYIKVNKNVFQFPMTIEMWVKTNDPAGAMQYVYVSDPIVGNGWGVENECHIGQTSGQYGFYCQTTSGKTSFFTNIPDSNWHHLAIVYDTQSQLYLDGVLIKSSTVDYIPDFSSYVPTSYIGRAGKDNRYVNGSLSDLRIWNTARSASEIANMRFQPLSGNESGLVAYYPLDGLFSGQALDKTAAGVHGKAFGFLLDSQPLGIQVTAGSFGFTSPTLIQPFPTVTLNGSTKTTYASLSDMTFVDARGSAEGWNLQVSATRFQEIGGQGYQLASNSLTLSPPVSITPIGGTDSSIPYTSFPSDMVIDNNVSSAYLVAQPNEGMGTFTISFPTNSLKLSVNPATTYVDKTSYPSTATPYASTITWTLVTGP